MNNQQPPTDVWSSGDVYEPFIGRWSRRVAELFLSWLAVLPGSQWLDVGCGTGALTQTILERMAPSHIKGVDRSEDYVAYAKARTADQRAQFEVGDATALPIETASYDVTVSGLMLNFVPQPEQAIAEMVRATKPGGVVAVYLWDYAGKMQLLRHFWNAAVALNPQARDVDEGYRFPICNPRALAAAFEGAGLKSVEARAIDIDTDFKDFDDYWSPFLGGQGPAPTYTMSLSEQERVALRERIRNSLPFALDGSIPLVARAWAVRGVR